MKGTLFTTLAAVAALLVVAACGDKAKDSARIKTCTKLAQAALQSPNGFKVVGSSEEETSEGMGVVLDIEFMDASGAKKTVANRCWFAGGDMTRLTEFAVKSGEEFHRILPEQLDQLRKKIGS